MLTDLPIASLTTLPEAQNLFLTPAAGMNPIPQGDAADADGAFWLQLRYITPVTCLEQELGTASHLWPALL